MINENDPSLKELINSKVPNHSSAKPEQANADYWRLFYTIQGPLMGTECTNVDNKIHTIAKSIYKKWIEKVN